MYPNTENSDTADQMTAFVRRSRFARSLKCFVKDDSGVMLVFGVYIFILILMMGGIGIDLMRFERDRSNLQSTLDRAVLAAADLDQTLNPEAVVEDYFNKAGLSEFLISVTVDDGLGYRVVSALASSTIQTQFMRMTGVDTLEAPATGTAEERIDGVEISLILDVSGSMGSNSRLTNLKVAARDFIDTMMDNSVEGKVSISIVPYATQVSAPQYLFDELTVSQEYDGTLNEDGYSRCINFESSDFNTTSLDLDVEMQRTMHFDPWYNRDGRDDDPEKLVSSPVCEDYDSGREMMVLQKDRDALKSFISSFEARGNTSIDVGMKWGTALLDPSLKPAVTNMIGNNFISSDFAQRPHTYNDGETIKVIVLMTDGKNTSQYFIEDDFRTGDSNIWWNNEQEEYSVYIGLDEDDKDNDGITQEGMFFWPGDQFQYDRWHDHAYGEGTYEETTYERVCKSYRRNGSCKRYQTVASTAVVDEPGSAEIVSYPDLWAYTSIKWNLYNHYYPWMYDSTARNDWYYDVRSSVGTTTKNARTHAICEAAKNNSVLIYTIAFEAPSDGEVVLKDCASSASHFFSVSGVEIVHAFDAIASSIRQLRLTQ
ncbi:MAG: Flp pilus assembly protein TadG [Paracoccaceae bacterium]|jgi:Flp pilus assembly protein TadG